MPNEAVHLQSVMEACKRPATVLAVTSGKGGVGKTNISANLAVCLAASQKKVLLIDADMSLGNLDVLLNINSKYNISHLLRGQKTIDEIIQTGPHGIEILCGASGIEELANLNEFQQHRLIKQLSELQSDNDIIIIDTAAGISKSVIGFCLAADHALVVTTPEATSMTDAYAMIKVLVKNNFTGQINLVVNMAQNIAEGKKTYQQISKVVARFLDTRIYNAGILLKDSRLVTAVRHRKPVVLAYPNSAVTKSLAALAVKLGDNSIPKSNNEGFFKKVVDWLF